MARTPPVDRINVSLRAVLCHPHSEVVDLCLSEYPLWVVTADTPEAELIQLIPHSQAPTPELLRSYLRLCDYRGTLTLDPG